MLTSKYKELLDKADSAITEIKILRGKLFTQAFDRLPDAKKNIHFTTPFNLFVAPKSLSEFEQYSTLKAKQAALASSMRKLLKRNWWVAECDKHQIYPKSIDIKFYHLDGISWRQRLAETCEFLDEEIQKYDSEKLTDLFGRAYDIEELAECILIEILLREVMKGDLPQAVIFYTVYSGYLEGYPITSMHMDHEYYTNTSTSSYDSYSHQFIKLYKAIFEPLTELDSFLTDQLNYVFSQRKSVEGSMYLSTWPLSRYEEVTPMSKCIIECDNLDKKKAELEALGKQVQENMALYQAANSVHSETFKDTNFAEANADQLKELDTMIQGLAIALDKYCTSVIRLKAEQQCYETMLSSASNLAKALHRNQIKIVGSTSVFELLEMLPEAERGGLAEEYAAIIDEHIRQISTTIENIAKHPGVKYDKAPSAGASALAFANVKQPEGASLACNP